VSDQQPTQIAERYPRRRPPDCWIVLEPGWLFLWPLQGRRRWEWSVLDGVAGARFATGSEWGYDRAMAAAQMAARLGPDGPVPTMPDPGVPYEAEARATHVKPYWRRS
jgi:hypothetical protein